MFIFPLRFILRFSLRISRFSSPKIKVKNFRLFERVSDEDFNRLILIFDIYALQAEEVLCIFNYFSFLTRITLTYSL
jgi:hypothetical protein